MPVLPLVTGPSEGSVDGSETLEDRGFACGSEVSEKDLALSDTLHARKSLAKSMHWLGMQAHDTVHGEKRRGSFRGLLSFLLTAMVVYMAIYYCISFIRPIDSDLFEV